MEKDMTVKEELSVILLPTVHTVKGSSKITFDFNHRLKPIINSPVVFAKLKLIMLAVLGKPKTAYPLYELICDAYCRGERRFNISLKHLYAFLGISGTFYENDFKTFKKRILKTSVEALNKFSDYNVEYTTFKDGRKTAGITFLIEKDTSWQLPLPLVDGTLAIWEKNYGQALGGETKTKIPVHDDEKEIISNELLKRKVSSRAVNDAFDKWGVEGVAEIIVHVDAEIEKRVESPKPILNQTAYMAQSLKDGLGVKTLEHRQSAKQIAVMNEKRGRLKQLKGILGKVKVNAEAVHRRALRGLVDALPANIVDDYEAEFEKELMVGQFAEAFSSRGKAMIGYDGVFIGFKTRKIEETYPELTIERQLDESCQVYGYNWGELENLISKSETELKQLTVNLKSSQKNK